MTLEKDESIHALLAALDLRARGWVRVDNWDADLFAVGIARAGRPALRVYVSTYRRRICHAERAPQRWWRGPPGRAKALSEPAVCAWARVPLNSPGLLVYVPPSEAGLT